MQDQITALIKSLDNLVTIVTMYLIITWGYQGLNFLMETILR